MTRPIALLPLLALGACFAKSPTPVPMQVVRDSLEASGPVFLNQELRISFSDNVDPLSITPDTVRVRSLDSGEIVAGRLAVGTRTVTFTPRAPCSPSLLDGSFRPGGRYRCEVVGFPSVNAVRAQAGRLLARGHAREFVVVGRDHSPSPFLPVGIGDPRCAEFRPLLVDPVAADRGILRVHFNMPPDPVSVTPAAFILQRVETGVERLELRSVRVLQPGEGAPIPWMGLSSYPGSSVEVQIQERIQAGQQLFLSLESGPAALRDYAGRPVQKMLSPTGPAAVVPVQVFSGDRVALLEQRFFGHEVLQPTQPDLLGFETLAARSGLVRPLVRKEAGSGALGALVPRHDLLLVPGVPFDRGDGLEVCSQGPEFEFTRIDIPPGVTVRVRSSQPVVLKAVGPISVRGELWFEGTPAGSVPPMRAGMPGRQLLESQGAALLAGGNLDLLGSVRRRGAAMGPEHTPYALIAGGVLTIAGKTDPGVVLGARLDLARVVAEAATPVDVALEPGLGAGPARVAAAFTAWRRLPAGHLLADEVALLGLRGRLSVAVQVVAPDPNDPSVPIAEPSLWPEPVPCPLVNKLEWAPGAFVRFLLHAEVVPGEVLPGLERIELRVRD